MAVQQLTGHGSRDLRWGWVCQQRKNFNFPVVAILAYSFIHILNRIWKGIWFIYQIFLIQLLWFIGYESGTSQTRTPRLRGTSSNLVFAFLFFYFWDLTKSLTDSDDFSDLKIRWSGAITRSLPQITRSHSWNRRRFWDQAVGPGVLFSL